MYVKTLSASWTDLITNSARFFDTLEIMGTVSTPNPFPDIPVTVAQIIRQAGHKAYQRGLLMPSA